MKCPKCNEEMVEGEFRVQAQWKLSGQYGAWVRPVEVRSFMDGFLMRDDHRVHLTDQKARVCYHCGAVVLFIEDASAFRPKAGKETLPRPTSEPAPATENLPRPVGDSAPRSDTLPRPAEEDNDTRRS